MVYLLLGRLSNPAGSASWKPVYNWLEINPIDLIREESDPDRNGLIDQNDTLSDPIDPVKPDISPGDEHFAPRLSSLSSNKAIPLVHRSHEAVPCIRNFHILLRKLPSESGSLSGKM